MKFKIQEATPIFILGCERSGTTLLADYLGSIPESIVLPEFQFKRQIIFGNGIIGGPSWRWKSWGVNDITINSVKDMTVFELIEKYALATGKENIKYWIDHTPENIRIAILLSKAFPDAKFVAIQRDGRGVYSSLRRVNWGPKGPKAAAHYWSERSMLAHVIATHLGRGKCIEIHYEDLISNPTEVVMNITSSLCLKPPNYVSPGHFLKPNYSKTQHSLVNSATDISRVDAWCKELRAEDVSLFEYWAGSTLSLLGYPLISNRHHQANRKESIKELILNFKAFFQQRIEFIVRKFR